MASRLLKFSTLIIVAEEIWLLIENRDILYLEHTGVLKYPILHLLLVIASGLLPLLLKLPNMLPTFYG